MKAAELAQVDTRARAKFTYVADVQMDRWRSHADDVERGAAWEGDCDDLASTVLDLLGRAGLDLEDRYRLTVSVGRNGVVDHMVTAARDDDGRFWILGDTFAGSYRAEDMRHEPISYNHLTEKAWRQGAPWAVLA